MVLLFYASDFKDSRTILLWQSNFMSSCQGCHFHISKNMTTMNFQCHVAKISPELGGAALLIIFSQSIISLRKVKNPVLYLQNGKT